MLKHIPKWLKVTLQALVSVCLITFVLRQVDLTQVKSLLRPQGTPWLIAAPLVALLLFNASKIVNAIRLNVYQRHAAIHLSERENLRLYYAGMFLNLFLPGGIGGDGYKILVLNRRRVAPVRTLVLITLADRVSGLLILLLLLCLMLPLLPPLPPLPILNLSLTHGGAMVLAVTCGVLLAATFIMLHTRLLQVRGESMLLVFGYGLAVQLLQLACIALLLLYLQVQTAHFLAYLAVFLVSSVAAVLPLSFGGLGAREITFFYGLNLLSLDPTQGVVASSGFFLITLASSLVGALFVGSFSSTPSHSSSRTP